MSAPVIKVNQLSKQYRIGQLHQSGQTLREAITNSFQKLWLNQQSAKKQPLETIWALKDLSFAVAKGEVLGVVGRNGAGKSTLLKVLSRITEPTSGEATIHGRVGSLLEVGTGFHHELTGRENIYLSGAILGMRRQEIDRQFDTIVDFSGVAKFIDTPIKRYSSGMRVRLGFAVAAHLNPEILLIDEVLAVGDAAFQKKCLGKMGEIAGAGRTVLFVSHNMIALRNLCPRAIWLEDGELKANGPAEDVVNQYLGAYAENLYEQRWDDPQAAPGNELVRLRRIWLEADTPLPQAGIPREIPIAIGVEYWHLDPGVQLHITLRFYVEQHIVAFVSASVHDPSWQPIAQRQGLLRSVCTIPAHFLNTGNHNISLMVVKDRSRAIVTLENALSFDVIESEERTGSWYGKVAGVVRPNFAWTNSFLARLPNAADR